MATLDERYRINGLIDTSQTAISNLEKIVAACNTWLTYDSIAGQWSVVINEASSPVVTFTDADIVGGINLATTELGTFYNSCEVRYHNQELRDQPDFVLLETPAGERFGQEPDNRITIDSSLINNQIQAQLMGLIELKQSRLEKTIEFVVDYKHLGLDAGSVIAITNSVYGWTNQPFRILRIDQREQNGAIVLGIRAQEYRASVYDTGDLYQYLVEKEDGVFQLDPYKDSPPFTPTQQVVDNNGVPQTVASPWNMLRGLDGLYSGYRYPGQPSGILYSGIADQLMDDQQFVGSQGTVNLRGFSESTVSGGPWPTTPTSVDVYQGQSTGARVILVQVNVQFFGSFTDTDETDAAVQIDLYINGTSVANDGVTYTNYNGFVDQVDLNIYYQTPTAYNDDIDVAVAFTNSLATSAAVKILTLQAA